MNLYLHDNSPSKEGEKHGERGPTHAGTIRDIDFEYQAEQWVIDLENDHPEIVRIECPDLVLEWHRVNGIFQKVPTPPQT